MLDEAADIAATNFGEASETLKPQLTSDITARSHSCGARRFNASLRNAPMANVVPGNALQGPRWIVMTWGYSQDRARAPQNDAK